MTNQQILEKAIKKAIDGGWSRGEYFQNDGKFEFDGDRFICGDFSEHNFVAIFNHDFAKALWGEELHHETFIVPKELNKRFAGTQNLDIKPTWQYHLQQMVIAEDPIKYLGENI